MVASADVRALKRNSTRSLVLTAAACGAGALAAAALDRGAYWIAPLLAAPVYLTYRTHQKFFAYVDDALTTADRTRSAHEDAVSRFVVTRAGDAALASQEVRVQSERAAASKLESLGLLAGGIAHDFNNVLTAILGNISLAREIVGRSATADGPLADAEEACMRARQLTRQLLTFSKGGQPVKKPLLLTSMIRDSAARVLSAAPHSFSDELERNLPPVDADEGQLAQVFDGILMNAKEAMPGGGRVTIRGCRIEETIERTEGGLTVSPGPYIRISIADEGPGIPRDALDRVFEPYFSTKPGSSGLGLAVSRSIVKKHGGYIAIDSRPGNGATVHVVLPASALPVAAPAARRHAASTRPGGRVLVMDDAEAIRNLATNLLRLLGYDVETVAGGDAAIACYRAARQNGRPFDLVLLDLTIRGGIGGVEVLRALLEIDPDVQAIVISGYASDPSLARYREIGFKAAVAKPFTIRELTLALDTVQPGRPGIRHQPS
jgi:two-component system cell cycle sensor histidine kinase/response regulator CckA